MTSAMSTFTPRNQLKSYIAHLTLQALSVNYVNKVREFLASYIKCSNEVTPESAREFLGRYSSHKPNTRARYTTYIKGFLHYLGIPFELKVKVPKQLPPFIRWEDIQRLKETIAAANTHKMRTVRNFVLIDTACKTGLRRSELADLLARHIDFNGCRLQVVMGILT